LNAIKNGEYGEEVLSKFNEFVNEDDIKKLNSGAETLESLVNTTFKQFRQIDLFNVKKAKTPVGSIIPDLNADVLRPKSSKFIQ